MAQRNSARFRVPGSPLSGVLRQVARQSRSTARRSVATGGPQGATGVADESGPTGAREEPAATGATDATGPSVARFGQVTANASGVAVWTFSPALPAAPFVVATPVASATVLLATVAAVSTTSATVQIWKWDAPTKTFVAGGGGICHVSAYV